MKSNDSILVVEDDQDELKTIVHFIQKKGYHCIGADNYKESLVQLEGHRFTHVITDIHFVDKKSRSSTPDGLRLLKEIKSHYPEITAVAISSDPDAAVFEKALQFGAKQFIRKPILGWDEISIALNLANKQKNLEKSIRSTDRNSKKLPEHLSRKYPDGLVIGRDIRRVISAIAKRPEMILVLKGETGTGKEEVAKLLYKERVKADGRDIPFLAVNCAHLEDGLAQAKLFGHKKGSFTGADAASNGYVGDANGGILFLDELHNLNLTAQKMLLRVLNDGSYHRVGETKDRKSHFQLVVASTEDLDDLVEEGRILEDIRSRLHGHEISLKPLRERRGEIQDLIEIFFHKEDISISKSDLERIAEKLKTYYWRGNIRTLFSVLKNLILDCEIYGRPITAESITVRRSMRPPRGGIPSKNGAFDMSTMTAIDTVHAINDGKVTFGDAVRQFEKSVIERIIADSKNISAASERLGLARATLDSKRKKYGIL